MNIIVLHTREYNFEDEKTKKNISGIKIEYIFNDDMQPISVDANEQGYQIANGTLTLDKKNSIKYVPGVYEALFITRVNAKQQPVQKLLDIKYLSTLPEAFGVGSKKTV